MGERIQVSNLFSMKQNSTLKVIFPNNISTYILLDRGLYDSFPVFIPSSGAILIDTAV